LYSLSSQKESCQSIVFLTENENASRLLIEVLLQEKYAVHLHLMSKKQLDTYALRNFDLFIIDSQRLSLEELSVYPLIRTVYTGLLMVLTDYIDEMLQVLLYEQGVDDLLIKPVNHLLMLARIRALLRRKGNRVAPAVLLFNGLEINNGLRRVMFHGQEIPFTAREFDLLWYMAKNACTTLDRDQLYKEVFGLEYNGYDRSIDMYIARIRSKMAPFPNLPQMIKTVRGNGYLFAAEH
jgi:two-component system, OmpR family, response regulator RstA